MTSKRKKPKRNKEGAFSQYHNKPGKYPRSCVCYVRFESSGVQRVFNYLQEKEKILIDVETTAGDSWEKAIARARREEAQAMLIFVAHNFREAV